MSKINLMSNRVYVHTKSPFDRAKNLYIYTHEMGMLQMMHTKSIPFHAEQNLFALPCPSGASTSQNMILDFRPAVPAPLAFAGKHQDRERFSSIAKKIHDQTGN